MSSHTPGPWVAVQREFGYPNVEGGPIIRAWDVRATDGSPVAIGTIADENAGNARLIAAAPDLVAAMDPRSLEVIADEIDDGNGLGSKRAASLRAIATNQRVAIAKATGQTPKQAFDGAVGRGG